jgi:ABC-type phosphate transport system substrate-binding protein
LVGLSTLLSVICCGAFADSSALAYTPPTGLPTAGLNCAASDGKIDGRGSTYQEEAQQKSFALAYTQDFCGEVAEQPENTERSEKDPAGHTMVAYNYKEAKEHSDTGSGAGLKAMECRTDDFAGTDLPYSTTQLNEMNGAVFTAAACEGLSTTLHTPFAPLAPWPSSSDKPAKVMSFPIAGSSAALPTNLTTATCGGSTPPTTINLTGKEVSRIFGGDAKTWNDAELVANNAGLSPCTGTITRVVRQDNSGTTNIFKSYLVRVDNERTGASCAPTHKWAQYFEASPNTPWPIESEGGTCSTLLRPAKSGNGEVLANVKATPGSIGYVDLPQAINQGVVLANVRNATNTSYQTPQVGHAANCNYGVLTLPGLTSEEAVGLSTEDNWSNNNEKPKAEGGNEKAQHGLATDLGAKYPICGLTWDLVYTHLASESDPEGAIKRMTPDQRRTMYSYFTFILSSAGQDLLNEVFYAPLPASWLPTLREGFQNNF